MSRIYVDPSALLLPSADPAVPDDLVAPGASDALQHLVEAGFDVVLLADEDDEPAADLPPGLRRVPDLPEQLGPGAWYLTGEPTPTATRGGTTIFVGPRRPKGALPLPRFDLEARDMASAAMEILARDAMP